VGGRGRDGRRVGVRVVLLLLLVVARRGDVVGREVVR